MSDRQMQDEVLLGHKAGLHARPAVKFTQTAKGFESDIEFSSDEGENWINAKSIVKVMGAKVPTDTLLLIRATGPDADRAISELVQLVKSGFEDADSDDSSN